MIGGSVGGIDRFDDILAKLKRARHPDLIPLAEDLKNVLIEGNREGLLAGTDADGKPMADLEDSTIKRGRGGYGPPTVPRFAASGLVDRFKVTIAATSLGFTIKAGWRSIDHIRFLKTGTRHMPPRNPVGVRPETRAKFRAVVAAFAKKYANRFWQRGS